MKFIIHAYLNVCAVFDSRFNDEILIGTFFVLIDELSSTGKWLNCTEFMDLRV